MIPRRLEPEVMDDAQEATDYHAMGHSEVNRMFVSDFLRDFEIASSHIVSGDRLILDVGTGTAQIPIELCHQVASINLPDLENLSLTGIDLSKEMLRVGKRAIKQSGLDQQIQLAMHDARSLKFADETFDAVISNSLVHHIADPLGPLTEMCRVLKFGGLLFVRDLIRPDDLSMVEKLVSRYAGSENERQQGLFRDSLRAALAIPEMEELVKQIGLDAEMLKQTSDRHWTLSAIKTR